MLGAGFDRLTCLGHEEIASVSVGHSIGAMSSPSIAVLFRSLGPYHQARVLAVARMGCLSTALTLMPSEEPCYYATEFAAAGVKWTTLCSNPAAVARGRRVYREIARVLEESGATVIAVPGWSDPLAAGAVAWC